MRFRHATRCHEVGLNCGFGSRTCIFRIPNAKYAVTEEVRVYASMGRLAYLPAGVSGADPDAFLSDVLTGWRRAHLAQNFSTGTARHRVASVLRMTDFVGSHDAHPGYR